MRSRAATIGARMEFLPSSNGGLELRLSLPLIDLNEQTELSSVA